jgi:glycosyltransferase involved in cell wall biosynthesis
MVKDEADIIEATVRHMLTQVDSVVVADNGSTDGTRDILASLPVVLLDDLDPAYYQSAKMTELARKVADGDWVVPFDADEVPYSIHGRLADVLGALPPFCMVAEAEVYDHVPTAVDPPEPNPVARMRWRRPTRLPLPKIACRARPDLVIATGNHGAAYDSPGLTYRDVFTVRHFPYRSAEQFVRKARNGARAYALTDLPESAGAHWRGYGRILEEQGEEALASVFREWFWSADPEGAGLLWDPAPVGVRA